MKLGKIHILLFTFLIVSGAVGGATEQKPGARIVFDLGEIVVISEREESAGLQSTEIKDEDRITAETADDVSEALSTMKGVVITTGSKDEARIIIRGFDQEKVVFMLDGVPIYSPYYGDLDISELPTGNLSRIVVEKGASSALYGVNSMGGVVNLVTQKPLEGYNLDVTAEMGRNDYYRLNLNHGYKSQEGYYYQLSTGYKDTDGFQLSSDFDPPEGASPAEDGNLRENSHYTGFNASFKLGYEWDDLNELSVSYNMVDSEKGIPPSVEGKTRYWRFPVWKKHTAGIYSRIATGTMGYFRSNIFYHKYDNILKSYESDEYSEIQWTSAYDDYSFGAQLQYFLTSSDEYNLRSGIFFTEDNHKSQDDLGEPWEQYEAQTFSFALEGDWEPLKKVTLEAGFHYDLLNQIDTGDHMTAGNDATSFNPHLSVGYETGKGQRIFAAAAFKNRFPTLHQLYTEEYGNPGLKLQESVNYEIGYNLQLNRVKFQTAFFYSDISNLIDRKSRNDPFENINEAKSSGLETGVDIFPAEDLQISLSHTWTETKNESPGTLQEELPHIPTHSVNLFTEYKTFFGLQLSLNGIWRSTRYEYDRDDNKLEVDSYSLWDIRAEQEITSRLRVYAAVKNIFDEDYYEEIGYYRAGRDYRLGLIFQK